MNWIGEGPWRIKKEKEKIYLYNQKQKKKLLGTQLKLRPNSNILDPKTTRNEEKLRKTEQQKI